jgi:hypothetical protein
MTRNYLKFFLAALLTASPLLGWAQKGKGTCFVTHFKSQVLKVHDPELRAQVAEDWLKRNLSACTSAQLRAIQSNSPLWLGTALTAEVSSLIEVSIEASISGNPDMMGKLYGSVGKEGTAAVVTQSTSTPRAPVVQAPMVNAPVAGAVNYGRITGDTVANTNTSNVIQQYGNANTIANANLSNNLSGTGNRVNNLNAGGNINANISANNN